MNCYSLQQIIIVNVETIKFKLKTILQYVLINDMAYDTLVLPVKLKKYT